MDDVALLRVVLALLAGVACVTVVLMARGAAFHDDAWFLPMTAALAGTAYLKLQSLLPAAAAGGALKED